MAEPSFIFEPTIATSLDGKTVVAAWRGGRVDLEGEAVQIRNSSDFGKTWAITQDVFVNTSLIGTPRSINLTVSDDGKIVHLWFWSRNRFLLVSSVDSGATWGSPTEITDPNKQVNNFSMSVSLDGKILTGMWMESDGDKFRMKIRNGGFSLSDREVHSLVPGTSCKAADPGNSIKLQSREQGLTNTETEDTLSVICPVALPFTDAIEVIGDTRFSITMYARQGEGADAETTDMSCTLDRYEGQTLLSSQPVQVPLQLETQSSGAVGESLTVSYLGGFTITCDLPPQTAITSIETRAIY